MIIKSTGLVLARNSLYNLATQIVVSVLAFVSIPIIVRDMGEEAFGVLTLIWMVVGYFSILDLGVGQASVKFLAEQLVRGENDDANSTVWVSVGVSVAVGLCTSLLILMLIPLLLNGTITIPISLYAEAKESCYLVTLAVPFVMLQSAFRAVPMAVQRFDLFNLLTGLSGLLQWGGSLVLVLMGMGLLEVVILTVIIRVVGAIVAYLIAIGLFPELSLRRVRRLKETAKKLLKFGGWLTVSQAVSPVTRYLDRIFIVSYQTIKMFTFYSVPYEAMSRLQVIPISLTSTLFPALAERGSATFDQNSSIRILYMRVLNLMVLIILPISAVLMVFSHEILSLWLGGEFPTMSNGVFRILAMAISIHAIGYIPLTALQAVGKPDIVAKLNFLEIPVYILLCWLLIPNYGIEGAAWAWLVRLLLLTSALLWAANKSCKGVSDSVLESNLWRSLFLNLLVLCLLVATSMYASGHVTMQVLVLTCVIGGYIAGVWFYCLGATERQVVVRLISRQR